MAPALQLIACSTARQFSVLKSRGLQFNRELCPGKGCLGKLPEGGDDCELRDKQMPAEGGVSKLQAGRLRL